MNDDNDNDNGSDGYSLINMQLLMLPMVELIYIYQTIPFLYVDDVGLIYDDDD